MKKSYYYFFGEGSKINQIISGVLINLPLFAYGASVGWMSPMTLLLQSDNPPGGRKLTDTEISWMAAVPYIISTPLVFIVAFLGDRIGRKRILLFNSLASVCCWSIKLASTETWAFLLARSLVGLHVTGCYVICPLYTKEISENSIRGRLGYLVIFFHTAGTLFLYIIGDFLDYTSILWVCLMLPTIHMILFLMIPDSPSYLVKKGKIEEATRVLAWLRCRQEGDVVVQNELNALRKEKEKDDQSNRFILREILTSKILFRAFRIAMLVSFSREICGSIPVTNFAGDIFKLATEKTGTVLSPNRQAMMLGTVQVAGSILGSSVVDKVGRKPLLFTTALISGISMCALASWFLAREFSVSGPDWLPIVALCLCIFCDALGLLPVCFVLIGEIFSFKYRGTVIAIAMGLASLSAFLQLLFFKPLANIVGIYVSFYFFGAICLLAAIYVLLVVPETKKRTVEEIYEDLKTKEEIALENDANVFANKKIVTGL